MKFTITEMDRFVVIVLFAIKIEAYFFKRMSFHLRQAGNHSR